MSEQTLTSPIPEVPTTQRKKSVGAHARLIGFITFISRLLGLARESVATRYFGAGAIWSAFTIAFMVPNLFRKLLGEGALSSAFIPLYAQATKRHRDGVPDEFDPRVFAAASVNLLCAILLGLTVVGELVLLVMLMFVPMLPDRLLAVKLSMVMLPYVLFICGTAFLGGILQVHERFAAITFTSVLSNLCLIVAMVIAAKRLDLTTDAGQIMAVWWLSVSVLIAGVLQVAMLMPSLHAAGFRFMAVFHFNTPPIRKMMLLTLPVALSAGVLQIGVMLDKSIAFLLAESPGRTTFSVFGHAMRFPMVEGATVRLNLAQFMYQFPLGVFAIALATAIFPRLSTGATRERIPDASAAGGAAAPIVPAYEWPSMPWWRRFFPERETNLQPVPDAFKSVLREGIEASLFIGLPASVGMVLVREPAVRLLFERGQFTASDTAWVALSTGIYSAAIWAFSMQQILSRAYFALHDAMTPLIWTLVNLLINLVVEIPLIWTPLGEAGMAVGTLASFAVQAVVMLWMLDKRVGGLGMKRSFGNIGKMLIASALMGVACYAVQKVPGYPTGSGANLSKLPIVPAMQLGILMVVGGVTYFGACIVMGLDHAKIFLRRKRAV